jgi:hypothetical protein
MDRSHKAKASAEGWVTLPAEGRDGPEPVFPLAFPAERELELWTRLWESPQAVMWERLHLDFEVASYVRLVVRAEAPRSSATLWGQVKQFAESLGLSVSGMARNRWTVAKVPEDDDDVQRRSTDPLFSTRKGAAMAIQRIRVRLHADEWAELQRLAAESGRTYNDLMREALRRLAENA